MIENDRPMPTSPHGDMVGAVGLPCIPGLGKGRKPIGFIYTRDALQNLMGEVEDEDRLLRDYISGVGYQKIGTADIMLRQTVPTPVHSASTLGTYASREKTPIPPTIGTSVNALCPDGTTKEAPGPMVPPQFRRPTTSACQSQN